MVRRTKADAEATRNTLLDAAEHLFQVRGVSRTSLNDIAQAAGTTRGAIYWHFKDKADLFNAMMERVTLPFEETMSCVGKRAPLEGDPLQPMREAIGQALHKTATDEQTRRVFEIATLQVEYNEEMHAVRERHLQVRNQCVQQTAEVLRAAVKQTGTALPIPLNSAAMGLHVMIDGLIQNWLLDPSAFDLEACGTRVVNTYLQGLGFPPKAQRSETANASPDKPRARRPRIAATA